MLNVIMLSDFTLNVSAPYKLTALCTIWGPSYIIFTFMSEDTCIRNANAGNPHQRGRLSTVDLPVLASLDQLIFKLKISITFFNKTICLNE